MDTVIFRLVNISPGSNKFGFRPLRIAMEDDPMFIVTLDKLEANLEKGMATYLNF